MKKPLPPPPLSLYIHIPWCVKKCPYCDFNSHAAKESIPESFYIGQLLKDLALDMEFIQDREIMSIFIGGGTPSLFSAQAIEKLLNHLSKNLKLANNIEITLEANPGTIEAVKFKDFYNAGINRLSIGIQSFQDEKLKVLGRIHDADQAMHAIEIAHQSGFCNINLDLMFGLPNQTLEDALYDLQTAIDFKPQHISWYQLTLEPNTLFYSKPPPLPIDEKIFDMQLQGQVLLAQNNYLQYEVSAYSKKDFPCKHNLNYWQFGDYLGMGAGAHGKITMNGQIIRTIKQRHPKDYLAADKFIMEKRIVEQKDIAFEYMLNALRLNQPVSFDHYTARTGMSVSDIQKKLDLALSKGLIECNECSFTTTTLGKRFLNDLVEVFL